LLKKCVGKLVGELKTEDWACYTDNPKQRIVGVGVVRMKKRPMQIWIQIFVTKKKNSGGKLTFLESPCQNEPKTWKFGGHLDMSILEIIKMPALCIQIVGRMRK
jgi:hypothetical protein